MAHQLTDLPGWMENITQTHQFTVTVDVLNAYWVPVAYNVPIVSLEWAADGSSNEAVTGRMTVPVVDTLGNSWWPTSSDSPLSPFGNRVKVSATVVGATGAVTVLLGHALIMDVEVTRPEGILAVTLGDIGHEYAQSRIPTAMPDDGSPVYDANNEIIDYVLNSRQFYFAKMLVECRVPAPRWDGWDASIPTTELPGTRGQFAAGTSRMEVMQRIADQVDKRIWIDRTGHFRLMPSTLSDNTTPTTATPVVTLSTGDRGTVTSYSTAISREDATNRAVIYTGRNEAYSTADVSVPDWRESLAKNKPMLWPGTIGDATYVEEWGSAANAQSLQASADQRLGARLGVARRLTVQTVPVPFIDPGDVVALNSGTAVEKFVVRSWRLTVPQNTMTVEAVGWVTQNETSIKPMSATAATGDSVVAWPLEQQHAGVEIA